MGKFLGPFTSKVFNLNMPHYQSIVPREPYNLENCVKLIKASRPKQLEMNLLSQLDKPWAFQTATFRPKGMPSLRIFVRRVEGFIFRSFAAPFSPSIRPPVIFKAFIIA